MPLLVMHDMWPAGGEVCVRYSMARCGYSPPEFTSWNPQQTDFRDCFLGFRKKTVQFSAVPFLDTMYIGTLPADGWPWTHHTQDHLRLPKQSASSLPPCKTKTRRWVVVEQLNNKSVEAAENLRLCAIQNRGSRGLAIHRQTPCWR